MLVGRFVRSSNCFLSIMERNEEICKSLVKWLQSVVPNPPKNYMEICDGVAPVEALAQIAPDHFAGLIPKINKNAGNNWRLRVSNLKKIVQSIIEYYQEVHSLQLAEISYPDVLLLGEKNDLIQLGKLIRLILGCAINCDQKQEYITRIMEMEESVQQCIMQAIQELEEYTLGPGKSGLSLVLLDNDTRLRLVGDLDAANKEREVLVEQCQNLESQIQILIDEKQAILLENETLKENENKHQDMRKQIERLKEDLFRTELARDDFKARIGDQEKQILQLLEKISDLQKTANDTSRLKDEVDALSESAVKVKDLEYTLNSYKKKLEHYSDMKKAMQNLEKKNMEYIQKNLDYEEERGKYSLWKSQCETLKQQLADIQQKMDEEIQRADKAEFNVSKLESKLSAIRSEKERLMAERDLLREENEELRIGKPSEAVAGAAMAQELTPTEMKERLRHLEKENKTLRLSINEIDTKQTLLDNAQSRVEKLQMQNRSLNQTILKLEAQLEELNKSGKNESKPVTSESTLKEYKQKLLSLQEALTAKETELAALQARYARNVEKARDVAQSLDFKSNGSAVASTLQQNQMKEIEQRLISTAYYRLALICQREAMEERLTAMNGGQRQSFLARQRQATPRKQVQRYKTK